MKVGGVFEGIIGDDNDFESSKIGVRRQNAPAQLCVDSRTSLFSPQRSSQPFQLLTPEF